MQDVPDAIRTLITMPYWGEKWPRSLAMAKVAPFDAVGVRIVATSAKSQKRQGCMGLVREYERGTSGGTGEALIDKVRSCPNFPVSPLNSIKANQTPQEYLVLT